jgi:tetratricopeptide (TPR) repeat protein
VKLAPNDKEALSSLAFNIYRWGRALFPTGDLEGSAAALQESIGLWEAAFKSGANEVAYQHGLGETLAALAVVQRNQGDLVAARKSLERAAALLEKVVAARPSNPMHRHILAGTIVTLGEVNHLAGRQKDAEASIRIAMEHWDRLCREQPNPDEFRRWAANARGDLGEVQRALGDLVGASRSFEEGIQTLESLAAKTPSWSLVRDELARLRFGLSQVLLLRKSFDPAVDACRRAITEWEDLRREGHVTTPVLPNLASAHVHLAQLHLDRGELAVADQVSARALEMSARAQENDSKSADSLCLLAGARTVRARVLRKLGKEHEALALFVQAVDNERHATELAPQIVQHHADLSERQAAVNDASIGSGRNELFDQAFPRNPFAPP